MEVIRCLIADDEPIARQILESYINELPHLTLVAKCKNAFEVMEVLQTEAVDLMLLDINMPKLSGLSLLKTLRNPPKVIITTAYPEYAVEGFELSVSDYLLKPISLERFIQAIMKVSGNREATTQEPASEESNARSIFVKSDKRHIKLNLNDISHVEAYGNYIKIYATTMVITSQTLSDFAERLPNSFMRIHKSFIINFGKLAYVDGNQIVLDTGAKLPVGKSYKKELLQRIEGDV
jgi:DNA-binding LytR/AlgR family response regulator